MPQVVVDVNGLLVVCNNAARAQFSITHHHIGRPFQDHELSYRPIELRSRIERAFAENKPLIERGVERPFHDGSTYLDIRIAPLADVNGAPIAAVVSFTDITRDRDLRLQLEESRNELETAYEELQSTNEELETTNEELQSTVEELETTNEELQSTNEELETMNEELQSTNVEIETVNEELRDRTEELDRVSQYTRSVLDGMGMGVVVLDKDLKVRTWNTHSQEMWGLGPEHAEGRPFLGLDIGLPVQELRGVLNDCLAGTANRIEHSLLGHDRKGKRVQHEVICVPLRDHGSDVRGVIVLVNGRDPGVA
jgi:two-component system CheB/CheR fusion protein